jgi:TonB family protein
MKNGWFCFAATMIFTSSFVIAQQADESTSNVLNFEHGVIKDGVYSNECLGISMQIPTRWELASNVIGEDGKAKRSRDGLTLAVLRWHGENALPNIVSLAAREVTDQIVSAKNFVSDPKRIIEDMPPLELVRDVFSVNYAGRQFVRGDYKLTPAHNDILPGGTLYFAFICTKFRGYFIGELNMTGTLEEADESADSLRGMSFQEDEVNPKCSLEKDKVPGSARTLGEIRNSVPNSAVAMPQPVGLPKGVSQGLLIEKVQPAYPPLARRARIQGEVVLRAIIDKDGNIADLTLISGHPMLAPSALEAVKQWKYKPYLLEGQPVTVETQITVNFALTLGVPNEASNAPNDGGEEARDPGTAALGATSSAPVDPNLARPVRVRISQGVSQGLLIKKVTPIYPEYARQNRIQGQVILQAEISKLGDIDDLQLVSGDPELASAAIEAVKQWKYKPYLLQGQPVKVETQIKVNFTLVE